VTHLEYAKALNVYSYELKVSDNTTNDLVIRVKISRLYYALFHRIIQELPKLQASSAGSKHDQILRRLEASGNTNTQRVFQVFKDLKRLRELADYEPSTLCPLSDLAVLYAKTHKFIKSDRIIIN